MTNRLSLFIAAHVLFTVGHSLADSERHEKLRQQMVHMTKRANGLQVQLEKQREIIRDTQLALSDDDTVLGHRIDAVSENLSEVQSDVESDRREIGETAEDVEQVLARLSDVEVAVGMPGSEMILEPSVELVQPTHTLNNCKAEFRTIDWNKHSAWAIDGIKRGWSCGRLSASLVRSGHVTGDQALAVCAALYPRLPWAKYKRRLQRWRRKDGRCSSLAERLREKSK